MCHCHSTHSADDGPESDMKALVTPFQPCPLGLAYIAMPAGDIIATPVSSPAGWRISHEKTYGTPIFASNFPATVFVSSSPVPTSFTNGASPPAAKSIVPNRSKSWKFIT